MRIEYHRTLVTDRVRNEAFWTALKAVIKPGETVVADIGAGTGLLGMMAAKLGAKEVYLYETAEVAGLARDLLKLNKMRNCILFPCHSTEMENPPRVDLVVSETLGNYPLEEDIVATLKDAKKRHLKPDGKMIPSRVRQFVAPVVSDRMHRELVAWDDVGYGIEFAPARTMSMHNIYVRTLALPELLDGGKSAVQWDDIDLTSLPPSNRKGETVYALKAPSTIYGFAIWWIADLAGGVVMSTAPDAPKTHWEQLYLPLLEPIAAKAGEKVSIALRSRTTPEKGTTLAWTATHMDGKGRPLGKQALDLEKGYLP
jgi:Ribosomal protein L11 methyltransferase (PrmA)